MIRGGKFNKGVDHYLTALAIGRKMDDIGNKIHFINGSFDLEMNLFYRVGQGGREKEDLITKCISYELESADDKIVANFDEIMQQSFPEPNVWEYVKFLVGKSLSAESVQDCEFLLFFGTGNNGKSTLLNLLRSVLEEGVYVQTYNHTVFDSDAEFIRSFRTVSPSVRFYLAEELSSKKKAVSNLKMMCDGKLFIRELRGHTTVEIPIRGKLLATSNDFIRFTDGGINRRILYYNNKVKFVSEDTILEAGETRGSPLLRREAIAEMTASMKSVIFLAFASMAVLYIRGERDVEARAHRPVRPLEFVARGDELPTWSTFVEAQLVSVAHGRIGKMRC
jgi:phage/plasmid-associated DNA primase